MTEQSITPLQATKDSRMTDVLILLFSNPMLKMADACRAVGVEYDSFRYWQRNHPDFISNMRALLGEYQKEQLLGLELAWSAGLTKLMQAEMAEETSADMRLELHKYLTTIRDSLLKTYHAEPGLEEEAQRFLSQGPKVTVQESRFASLELTKTADGVRLDLYQPEKVIDAVEKEIAPQTKSNHQSASD